MTVIREYSMKPKSRMPHEDQQEDREDERELDQGLAAGALLAAGTRAGWIVMVMLISWGRDGDIGRPFRRAEPSHVGAWCVNGTFVLSDV